MQRRAISIALILSCTVLLAGSCDQKSKKIVVPKEEPQTNNAVKKETKTAEDVGPEAPALFIISGLKGYTEPCGCTLDVMLGGIDRIVAFKDDIQTFHPKHLALHAGDLLFEGGVEKENEPQERARVDLVVSGLKRLRVRVTTPGPHDFALGNDFLREKTAEAGVRVLSANLTVDDQSFKATEELKLGGETIWVAAVTDPALFQKMENAKVSDPKKSLVEPLKNAPDGATKILLVAGDVAFARTVIEGFDFAVVGKPRETDQSDPAGAAFTLEPYDQGRYFGVLKLYGTDKAGSYANARSGSKTELEKIERQIEHINASIKKLPPATPGNEPEILLNLRKRLQATEERKQEILNAKIEPSETSPSFLWRTVPMAPAYREDDNLKSEREAYNKSLKKLSQRVKREVTPPVEGQPYYVGNQECAMCHQDATTFWKGTAHSRAFATLEKRDKEYDHKCVSCHVVGYEKPGGSVIGQFSYDHELSLGPNVEPVKITKDLKNVGCENCHGPGSMHRLQPIGADGKAQHIIKSEGVSTCNECHVPEHSPKFNFPIYLQEILGPGHGEPAKK